MSDLYKKNETKKIIDKYNFSFSKKFGQNFLIDGNILNLIVNGSNITKDDYVLEIGTGIGTLTQMLCENSKHVVSVEIDESLKIIHKETLNYENLEILYCDFMECSLKAIAENEFNGHKIKVVANLPYYITTPIIVKLFENKEFIESITVMVQKEVAERLEADAGSRKYGSISAFVQYHSIPEILSVVPKTVFIPEPKVDSAIVYFKIPEESGYDVSDEDILFKVIRGAFGQRRKTFVNSLSGTYPEFKKNMIIETLNALGYKENIRGEKFTVDDFVKIANHIAGA